VLVGLGTAGNVAADADSSGEAYPPAVTLAPERGGSARPIPSTGNDDSGAWLTLGSGAVLAGSVLLTAARRRTAAVNA